MKPNGIRTLWAAGKPVLNGWLSIGSPFVAEILAAQGYDSITIDQQHGLFGYETMLATLQALGNTAVTSLVRVPWLDTAAIAKALDGGAEGIICPMISTREEAERLAAYMRYPPQGSRSSGPTRAAVIAGPDYAEHADAELLCFAMIETAEGYANVDSIVATPGIDGVYVGPSDLTLGLTGRNYRMGLDREEPEILDAIRAILASAHRAGKRAGLHTGGPDYAAKAIGWGFDLVTVSSDIRLLAAGAAAAVSKARQSIAADPALGATNPQH